MARRDLRIQKAAHRRDSQALAGNLHRAIPCACGCHGQRLGEVDPHPGQRCICKRSRVAPGGG